MEKDKWLGLTMGLVAALIGGGWQVATRHATTGALAPADLVLLRYGVPALLLLPITLRSGLWPRGLPWHKLALLVLGAGAPFGFVAISGTVFAPAAHMGVLMAGASPLFAAALAWALWRDRPDGARAAGLALMLTGVVLLGAKSFGGFAANGLTDIWRGDALFLLAAALWAGYTLTFRRSGLTPWQAAALVNTWSLLLVLAFTAWRGGTQLFEAPAQVLMLQFIWQGVLAGVLGLWTYSVAIQHLGAAHAAAFGALAPVVSALGGWVWLGDRLGLIDAFAVAAAVIGVLLASGALARPPATPGAAATNPR